MNDDLPVTGPPGTNSEDATLTTGAGAAPGGVVGPYRLLERLGSGGMGEVWKAEQTVPIRRIVALKLVKPGMDSREILARFTAERQALALMDHPCIAKIFDAGATPQGRPYFAMEYVQGAPITSYCDRRRLSMRQRLELFLRVCDGVQHAHQKAVIHRDLKPGNVLVMDQEGAPQPKIIDFGVAKAMTQQLSDRTMHTAVGQILGTPEYMSPEQAELSGEDVDTRTDVYSLGVILYELLAGALPFDAEKLCKAGFEGVLRIIREQDPPRPSIRLSTLGEQTRPIADSRGTGPRRLAKLLKGDLDWIVLRCLEKDRNQRYGSPQELAQDIRRHLADEPVLAGPPSTVYKLRKLVRRNRGVVTAMVVIFAALLLGMIGTTYGLVRARDAERYARAERDEARRQAAIAEAVNDFLNNDLLAAVSPSTRKGQGKDVPMREVLDVASERIESDPTTRRRFADKPDVEAAIRDMVGTTYKNLGEFDPALIHLERALAIREKHPGEGNRDLAATLASIADLYQARGDYGASATAFERAIALRSDAQGGPDSTAIYWLTDLASSYSMLGRSADAEPLFLQALARQRELYGEADLRTLAGMGALANFYQEMGRFDEAEPLQVKALDLRIEHFGEDDPSTLGNMNNLANVYASQGRVQDATPLYTRALALKRKIYGDDHPSTLNTWNNLAQVQELFGHYDEAERLHREVLDRRRRTLGPDHPRTLSTQDRLVYVLFAQGRLDEAERLGREVTADFARTMGDDHPYTLAARINLAAVLRARGDTAQSERLLRGVLTTMEREHPTDTYTISLAQAHLGLALEDQGRLAEAESSWDLADADLGVTGDEAGRIVRRVVTHYERRAAREPGAGFDTRVEHWRTRLAEVGVR